MRAENLGVLDYREKTPTYLSYFHDKNFVMRERRICVENHVKWRLAVEMLKFIVSGNLAAL